MKFLTVMCVLLAIVCGSVLADVADDWVEMDKLLDQNDYFQSYTSFESSPREFVEKWLKHKEEFVKKAENFIETYGPEKQDILEVLQKTEKPEEATRNHNQLANDLTYFNLENRSKSILEWTDRAAQQAWLGWERLADPDPEKYELKLKRAQEALTMFELAQKLDPEGGYDEWVEKAEDAVKETEPQVKKALESQVWPDHNPDYAGPGDPDGIAEAALKFLEKHPDWTKPVYKDVHHPYAAVVTGSDWEVYKREPLTQRTTQYSIDVLVAFTGEVDDDIAYVYHMVFYTAEEAGIEKGLPLKYANAEQYAQYKMLKKNIKKNSSSGGFGLWRLLTSLALILGGLTAAKTIITGKCPQLTGFLKIMESLGLPLGFILVILGLLGFLGNLVTLSPLASILTQLVAILLGIAFVRDALRIGFMNKFAFLDGKESTLGIAAVIMGIIHLILGGFILV